MSINLNRLTIDELKHELIRLEGVVNMHEISWEDKSDAEEQIERIIVLLYLEAGSQMEIECGDCGFPVYSNGCPACRDEYS